ncbi:MAG: prolipoprotein diacylglyceryl transferase [Candidatus Kerfeldbacteria bacterium]|nr:prolipoprotein diacylglyceryl transferase [Candidatus Kerfeldbacteria bacterium]
MFSFLHTFSPSPILAEFGPFILRWYGLLLALGAVLGYLVARSLARRYGIAEETVAALAFFLLIVGFIGARLYHVLNEPGYYFRNPADIVKVWKGGLAIHGAIIAGLAVAYWFCRKYKLLFWKMTDLLVPSLILGQAIGRWGNYFNQELFGLPTQLPWGIPINPLNRPADAVGDQFFHPTFLYESLWDLATFATLLILHRKKIKKGETGKHGFITMAYLALYSLGRLLNELLRIDRTPVILGIRLPILVSGLVILAACVGMFLLARRAPAQLPTSNPRPPTAGS